jgi:hypothetical protein
MATAIANPADWHAGQRVARVDSGHLGTIVEANGEIKVSGTTAGRATIGARLFQASSWKRDSVESRALCSITG